MLTPWVEVDLVEAALVGASAPEEVSADEVASVAVEALEGASVLEVGMAVEATQEVAAALLLLQVATARSLRIHQTLSPTLRLRAARRTRSSTSET